jgi:hypothetical protein
MLTPIQNISANRARTDIIQEHAVMPSICVHRACIDILWAEHSDQVAELIVRRMARVWKCDNARKALVLLLAFDDVGASLLSQ